MRAATLVLVLVCCGCGARLGTIGKTSISSAAIVSGAAGASAFALQDGSSAPLAAIGGAAVAGSIAAAALAVAMGTLEGPTWWHRWGWDATLWVGVLSSAMGWASVGKWAEQR